MNESKITCPDLRIGNWVLYCPNGFTMQVELIGKDYVYLNFEGNEGDVIECDVKDIAPIPLTEELLVNCGFKPISNFTITNPFTIKIGRNRVLSISDIDNANQMIWLQNVEDKTITDLVCLHNYDYDGIIFINKLQNLYYALTGKELKVKL